MLSTKPTLLSKLGRFTWIIAVSIYLAIISTLLIFTIITRYDYDHYYFQALSWLYGSNNIDAILTQKNLGDLAFYEGHVHMPLAPLPAVVALPFVAILGSQYQQWIIVYPLTVWTVLVVWRILKRLRVSYVSTRFWLLALFFLGTVYFSNILRPGS